MSLVLRPARREDVARILGFVRELAEYERLIHKVEATEAGLADAMFGDRPLVFSTLAEWDGEAVGFTLWFYNFSTFHGRPGIFLEDLFVRPAFRGRGIARALLAELAKRCIDEGLPRFEWMVLNWNEPAIAVYRRLGAEPMSDWTLQRVSGPALLKLAED
ncbi:GNAT family N-acetyltransferase [Ancylobacter lacus]|uniref:GNAT family N-acetyltransferase n=1 Tax=Ancylobacter lacus TaxID=2579970 RepID=UPI001BCCF473|nr:GNAT family N-acetyltransferase [Ancylobacter lacus]MBS7541464.1 GNAT family N-acetyltransferase [Ancylobacter lacus]